MQKPNNLVGFIRKASAIFFSVFLVLVAANWLDGKYFDYFFEDKIYSLLSSEDWSRAPVLPSTLDYKWTKADSSGFIRIAHALGGRGTPLENTLEALKDSLTTGIKLIEVDLTLGEDGQLYCFHGPGMADAKMLASKNRCDIDSLLAVMAKNDFLLVLDLKSDFKTSGDIILTKVKAYGFYNRIIFQLYTPQNVQDFIAWEKDYKLVGPIMTVYRSGRRARHIVPNLLNMNIRALTVPMNKIEDFEHHWPQGITFLAHPIGNCNAMNYAAAHGVTGGYVPSSFLCPIIKNKPPAH